MVESNEAISAQADEYSATNGATATDESLSAARLTNEQFFESTASMEST